MIKNWKSVKLGDLCDLLNGNAFKSKDYVKASNTLNIRMSNIRPNGEFDPEYAPICLPDIYNETYKKFRLFDGDIIIAMTDMANNPKILGIPTVVKNSKGRNFLLNQRVGKLFNIDHSKVDVLFLRHYLMQESVRDYYKSIAKKGVQVNIGKADILSVQIDLPPLSEQRKIAYVLSTMQTSIDQHEKLITQTAELKKAFLYELMTGQRRVDEIEFEKLIIHN